MQAPLAEAEDWGFEASVADVVVYFAEPSANRCWAE